MVPKTPFQISSKAALGGDQSASNERSNSEVRETPDDDGEGGEAEGAMWYRAKVADGNAGVVTLLENRPDAVREMRINEKPLADIPARFQIRIRHLISPQYLAIHREYFAS